MFFIGVNAIHAMGGKAGGNISDQAGALQEVIRYKRPINVEFDVARCAADVDSHVIPMICVHAIVRASTWVGLTLPGMIELPGSFSGRVISPRPQVVESCLLLALKDFLLLVVLILRP